MTIIFYAQPFDIREEGFYFRSISEFKQQAACHKNQAGEVITEFEIQYFDGELIDRELAKIWNIDQANMESFFDVVENWSNYEKTRYIVAVGKAGYPHDQMMKNPNYLLIDIHYVDNLTDLAKQLVVDGRYGDIPDNFYCYIDYEAIAEDLSDDYHETKVARKKLVYRIE